MTSATKDPITFQAKDFPKLHGQENYQIWANAWEVAFTMMEVWDVINGEKPETPAQGSSSDGKKTEEWTKKNLKAKFLLSQAINSSFHGDVSAHTHASDVWNALKDRFDKESPTTNVYLLRDAVLSSLKPDQNISDHITNFENAWNRLYQRANSKNSKSEFLTVMRAFATSEIVKGSVFMMSVMDQYQDICDILAAKGDPKYADLRDHFSRLAAERTEKKDGEKALFVPDKPKDNRRGCFHCKSKNRTWENHTTNNCRSLKNKRKQKERAREQNNTAAISDANVTVLMAKTITEEKETTTEWLCDSGASAHLSPNSGDFQNLNDCNKKIITAHGRIHQATAYGDVKLDVLLLDGRSHTVLLSGVLYVPSFRYSLISESCLDKKGVRIVVEKGKRTYEKKGKKFMVAEVIDALWHVKLVQQKALLSTYEETHQALGHPSVIKDC